MICPICKKRIRTDTFTIDQPIPYHKSCYLGLNKTYDILYYLKHFEDSDSYTNYLTYQEHEAGNRTSP